VVVVVCGDVGIRINALGGFAVEGEGFKSRQTGSRTQDWEEAALVEVFVG
jgi:hypothetical protein